jgi:hypothetical protein
MLLLNFTHPITDAQRAHLTATLGVEPEIRPVTVQIDPAQPLAPQISALVDTLGLSAAAWQTTPMIINPPGYAPATAALLAELHGRSGYFPAILRLRPVVDTTPTVYEVAEIVNLQVVREQARTCRE